MIQASYNNREFPTMQSTTKAKSNRLVCLSGTKLWAQGRNIYISPFPITISLFSWRAIPSAKTKNKKEKKNPTSLSQLFEEKKNWRRLRPYRDEKRVHTSERIEKHGSPEAADELTVQRRAMQRRHSRACIYMCVLYRVDSRSKRYIRCRSFLCHFSDHIGFYVIIVVNFQKITVYLGMIIIIWLRKFE